MSDQTEKPIKPKRIRNRSKKNSLPPCPPLVTDPAIPPPPPADILPPPMPTPSLRLGWKSPDVIWWMFTYKPIEAKEFYGGWDIVIPDLNAHMPTGDWDAN